MNNQVHRHIRNIAFVIAMIAGGAIFGYTIGLIAPEPPLEPAPVLERELP